MKAPAIELFELTKSYPRQERRKGAFSARIRDLIAPRYGTKVAVDRISFSVQPGERVAFIGPNGAGKSTTLKMLSGILHPTSGRAEVLGRVPWRERTRLAFDIGTVFGQRSQLWYHLPARDTFELLGYVYEIERPKLRARLAVLVDVLGIGDLLDKPVSMLSLGERMRAELAASLLHSPPILFLDEPTIGLDVTAKAAIRELLCEFSRRDGTTLLLTSHDTGDMEQICGRVLVINGGRLLWDGSIPELRRSLLQTKRICISSECEVLDLELPGIRLLSRTPYRSLVEISLSMIPVGAVVEAALRQGGIRDLTVEDPPLDDVVRAFYAGAKEALVP
jgi:ABC-2 type transport system ATP-binding protein